MTTANTIFDLVGTSLSAGGSVGELFSGGVEAVAFGGGVKGIEVGGGLNVRSPMPLETHGIVEENRLLFSMNPTNELEEIADTIKTSIEECIDAVSQRAARPLDSERTNYLNN